MSTKKKILTKPLKFGIFDIFYKISDKTLYSGEVLHGLIQLTLHRPVFVTSIRVTFYGEITYEILSTNFKEKHLHTSKFAKKTHEIFSKPAHETAMILQNGFYVYEFFVSTESDLPVSFVGPGSVRSLVYFCEATVMEILQEPTSVVNQQNSNQVYVEHIKRKPFLLRLPPNLNLEPIETPIVTEKNLLYVKNFVDTSGVIAASASLYKSNYKLGENLKFKVELLNCFRRLSVDVTVVQHGKICINETLKVIRMDLVKMHLGELKSCDTYKAFNDRYIWLPDESLAPNSMQILYKTHLILVWYTFVVTVRTWPDKVLSIEIPLKIANNGKTLHKNKKVNNTTVAN